MARFILDEYGVGEVMVLVDTYGRILTEYDSGGDFRTAVVWVPGDSRIDWDSASDPELEALLNKYGYNDALLIEASTNNVLISTNDETETLVWDNTAMDFTVDFDQWQNGTPTLFYHTVSINGNSINVLVNADKKPIMVAQYGSYNNVLFDITQEGMTQLCTSITTSLIVQAITSALGNPEMLVPISGGDTINVFYKEDFSFFVNDNNDSVTPNLSRIY